MAWRISFETFKQDCKKGLCGERGNKHLFLRRRPKRIVGGYSVQETIGFRRRISDGDWHLLAFQGAAGQRHLPLLQRHVVQL